MSPTAFDRRFCSDYFGYIQHHGLLPAGSRCLLAVSGGLDSMVLLDLFQRFARKKYQADFVVAHLDHGLRPDSAEVASWLGEHCAAAGIAFVSQRIEVLARHATAGQSSIEAVARDTRYAWLAATAREQNCARIATAHSASDQAETVLMRLIRGGIAGLGGMAPARSLDELQLIRPLLGHSRTAIAAYAAEHDLSWREDPSNQDLKLFRNRVRAELMPWLLQENPRLEAALSAQTTIWQAEQAWLEQQAEALFAEHVRISPSGLELNTRTLLALPLALQRRLLKTMLSRHLGQWKRYGQADIEALRQLAAGPGGKQLDLSGDLRAYKRRGQLGFEARKPD